MAEPAASEAGFLRAVKAVLWAFFGVRREDDLERDAAQIGPLHVVVAGVLGTAVLVAVLLLIVRSVVK